jgi:diguanylate cyclase (GGDEF)-like protein
MSDAIYRFGGEEFLCIFPEQDLAAGSRAVQRMRAEVERLALPSQANPCGVLTISAGVAILDAECAQSAQDVIKAADEALYRAKELGRNRVEVVSATQPALSAPSEVGQEIS